MVDYDPSLQFFANSRAVAETDDFFLNGEYMAFYNWAQGDGSASVVPGAILPYVLRIDVSQKKEKKPDADADAVQLPESRPIYYRHISKLGTYKATRSLPDGFFHANLGGRAETSVGPGEELLFTITLYEWDRRTILDDDEYDQEIKEGSCQMM